MVTEHLDDNLVGGSIAHSGHWFASDLFAPPKIGTSFRAGGFFTAVALPLSASSSGASSTPATNVAPWNRTDARRSAVSDEGICCTVFRCVILAHSICHSNAFATLVIGKIFAICDVGDWQTICQPDRSVATSFLGPSLHWFGKCVITVSELKLSESGVSQYLPAISLRHPLFSKGDWPGYATRSVRL